MHAPVEQETSLEKKHEWDWASNKAALVLSASRDPLSISTIRLKGLPRVRASDFSVLSFQRLEMKRSAVTSKIMKRELEADCRDFYFRITAF